MLIETEDTLNPNVCNFYFDKTVLNYGDAEYADQKTKNSSELLQNILNVSGVVKVLLLPDMLFVQKENQADWSFLRPLIMAEIVDYDFQKFHAFDFSKQDIMSQIEALIEAKIRPYLMRDGGNLAVLSFDNGVLKVHLQGRCHGCVHAAQTLKNAVESTLKKYLKSVSLVQEEN